MTHDEVIVDSIRGLVSSIPRDFGIYASISDGYQPDGARMVNVYIDTAGGPRILQASTEPQDDEMTLHALRAELLAWITERRIAA